MPAGEDQEEQGGSGDEEGEEAVGGGEGDDHVNGDLGPARSSSSLAGKAGVAVGKALSGEGRRRRKEREGRTEGQVEGDEGESGKSDEDGEEDDEEDDDDDDVDTEFYEAEVGWQRNNALQMTRRVPLAMSGIV